MAQSEETVNPYQSPHFDSGEGGTRKTRNAICVCIALACAVFGVADIYAGLFELVVLLLSIAMGEVPDFPRRDASPLLLVFWALFQLIIGVLFLCATKAWWKVRTVRAMLLTGIAWLLSLLVPL